MKLDLNDLLKQLSQITGPIIGQMVVIWWAIVLILSFAAFCTPLGDPPQ